MEEKIKTPEEYLKLFPNTRLRYLHDVNKTVIQGK